MKYTVRYAHLVSRSPLPVGTVVEKGKLLGFMGNTGKSDGAHLHIDVVDGEQPKTYKLADMDANRHNPNMKWPNVVELNWFMDSELFGCRPLVTTYYCEPAYLLLYKKLHPAYDVIPVIKATTGIHWNRSYPGKVIRNEFDEGYGWHIHVRYEK